MAYICQWRSFEYNRDRERGGPRLIREIHMSLFPLGSNWMEMDGQLYVAISGSLNRGHLLSTGD